MKSSFKYIAIFGLALSIASCTGSSTESDNTDQEKTEMNDQRGDAQMVRLDVMLNDGRQWEANPETVAGIEKMEETIKDYDGKESSPEMYREMSNRLMEQFEYIFKACTMKGEAHDQLHNYLKPMKLYFEELNSNDQKVAENAVKKFQQHLDAFPKYFKG